MNSNPVNSTEIELIFPHYNIDFSQATAMPLGNGHINNTYKLSTPEHEFVLQKINHKVFTHPEQLCSNFQKISQHLLKQKHSADYPLNVPQLILSKDGKNTVKIGENYWRLMEYIEDSFTLEVVSSIKQAAFVARAFAQFTSALSDFPAGKLAVIIPDFHDINFRMCQLSEAVANNNEHRLADCQELVDFGFSQQRFVEQVIDISSKLPVRVTHNDCKVNNLLFSTKNDYPCAVVDLDTCMPGLLMHDFGDMVRTCCGNLTEDDANTEKMTLNVDIFKALSTNYQQVFGDKLSVLEKQSLLVGAKLLPFIMGTRFLTDHLNGDKYYQVNRTGHNLDRAKNQFQLYKLLSDTETELVQFT
jgi:Ser/Thr protein kinase RdoA (MazF antagonist)